MLTNGYILHNKGDEMNGTISLADLAKKVERVIAGLDPPMPGADANQDGNINAIDITKVERIIAGLD